MTTAKNKIYIKFLAKEQVPDIQGLSPETSDVKVHLIHPLESDCSMSEFLETNGQ
jgi:hypothetical protein